MLYPFHLFDLNHTSAVVGKQEAAPADSAEEQC